RGEGPKLGQQLFAQRRRLRWIEGDRGLALPAAVDTSSARRSPRHTQLAVLRRAVVRCRRQRGWSVTKIRRIKILLAGDANECEEGIAAGGGPGGGPSPAVWRLRGPGDSPT